METSDPIDLRNLCTNKLSFVRIVFDLQTKYTARKSLTFYCSTFHYCKMLKQYRHISQKIDDIYILELR